MNNLDFLIPNYIIESAKLDVIDLQIELSATAALGNWPKVRVTVNELQIADQLVNHNSTICFNKTISAQPNNIKIIIERYGKTSKDTVIKDNVILENQSIEIVKLFVNGVDIVKSESIYKLGQQYRDLDDNQRKYFIEHGISTGPTHSLVITDNGYWEINLGTPILSGLARLISLKERHSEEIDYKLYNEIYNTILNINHLEQQIK